MTTSVREVTQGLFPSAPAATAVWDPIGTKLEDLAREWAVACLLEDPHGRVVCHALEQGAPESAVKAVISRSSSLLHRQAVRLRTTGRLKGGPLLTGSMQGWAGTVTVVPLAGAGHLWVFGDQELSGTVVDAIAEELGDLLHRMQGQATEPALHERLHGLGADVAALDSWVAVLQEADGHGWEPLAVHRALNGALAGCSGLELTVTHTSAFVLVRATDAACASNRISEALRRVAALLELTLVGSVAPCTSGVHRAREAAERALSALAAPGRCVTVEEARSYETVHRVLDVVRGLPSLSRDPLANLLEAGDLVVEAFRAWLDLHGDIPAAAARLGVHTNTLRYRIKRATGLVPADLTDPVARLEIHLRLLALDAGLGRR